MAEPDTTPSVEPGMTSAAAGSDPTGLRDSILKAMEETGFAKKQPEFTATPTPAASKNQGPAAQEKAKAAPDAPAAAKPDAAGDQSTQRGPDGKFLPKTAAAAEQPPTPEAQPDADEAPATWRAEAKELWTKLNASGLPPEQVKLLKDEIRKREKDAKDGIIAKDNELKRLKPVVDALEPVLAPRRQAWAAQGLNEQQALGKLLQLSDFASQKPGEFIQWLAQNSGIDLATLAQGAQQGGTTPDPAAALRQEIHGLKSELQAIKSGFQAQGTTSRAAEIQAFIDEKDSAGNPLRPDFDDVFEDVRVMLPALYQSNPGKTPRQVMEIAYNKAVWANDTTRGRMLERQEADKKAKADAANRAAAASNAARLSVDSGPPNHLNGGNGAPDPKDLRGLLEHGYKTIYGKESRLQ